MQNSLVQLIRKEGSVYDKTRKALWDTISKDDFKEFSDALYKQVPALYSLLSEDEKEFLFEDLPDNPLTADSFVNKIIRYNSFDFTTGEPILKQRLQKNWEWTKENLFPYHPETGVLLKFERFFGIDADQNVYLVSAFDRPQETWILKWEAQTLEENVESKEYATLEALGAQCPKRLNGFNFLDFSVLVIEFLQPLDSTDNPVVVGQQLLTTQLKYIHTYACYFDLKPDNIKKRNSKPPKYFIIDMNLSKEMQPGGTFQRLHWTPLFASQPFPPFLSTKYQVSSYVNDFLELGYVLHQLIAQRAYDSKTSIFKDTAKTIQNQYSSFSYLNPDDFLADPERMFAHKIGETTRGWKAIRRLLEFPLDQNTESITGKYWATVASLPHGFPPANIHELLASQLSMRHALSFLKETEPTLQLQCQVCSEIKSQFKCGKCYEDVAFLCSQACAETHVCK